MPDLDFVKVIGRLGLTVADAADADSDPEMLWCDSGEVWFTPLVTVTKVASADPVPATLGQGVFRVPVDSNGYLTLNGQQYVYLVNLTSDKVNPSIGPDKATHNVEFKNLRASGNAVQFESFNARFAPDTIGPDGACDITLLSPVSKSGATPIIRGEKGDTGADSTVPGPQGPSNFLVYTGTEYPVRTSLEPHIFSGPVNPDELGLMLEGDVWVNPDEEAVNVPSYLRVSDVGDSSTPGGSALSASTAAAAADPDSDLGRALDASYLSAGALMSVASAPTSIAPHPDFIVADGGTAATLAQTGLASIYWPKVIDCRVLTWAPAAYLMVLATDHDDAGGIAYSWSNDPLAFTTWANLTVTNMPATWLSLETPTPILDPANDRIVLLFQAKFGVGGRQNSHVATWTAPSTVTWQKEMPQFEVGMMGDGHGGYCSSPAPYGQGWALYSLAGGTASANSVMRVSTNLIDWTHIGEQITWLDPTEIIEWHRLFVFTWRGERWAILPKTPPTAGENATADYTTEVVKIGPDLRTFLSDPTATLLGAVDGGALVESVLPYGRQLVGYYREGGKTGSIKYAIAKG